MTVVEPRKRIGKYEVEEFLGGSMAHVYRARDPVLGRRVAVKVLTEAAAGDPEAKARFLQEARLASNIRHENIIRIYDFGEDQGRPFMVMEFVEGETLRKAIERGSLGDASSRLRLALQAARALEHIHSQKITHRDVKPENLHVDRAGKVRLMDFGIAKAEGANLAREGSATGTPFYMSPEQVLGRQPTAQADVYAFGVLLYELLTGQKAVTAQSLEQVFHQILYEAPDPAPLEAAGVDPAVRDLIARCTAKQFIQRPAGMTEVCTELERVLEKEPEAQSKAAAAPPTPPGLLSPSFQRPESRVQLRMPPPPQPKPAPAPLEVFGGRVQAFLRTPAGVMVGAACTVFLCVFLLYEVLTVAGLL